MHMYRCCWGSVHHFLCTCMYICVCMGLHMCVHCQGRGSVPTALKPLTLAQPGSSLEGSRTGSHRGCWHSCSYRVPPARHTHPHPGSHPRFGQSQSQRDRRSGSHLAYCGRRRCRRPPATGHIHSRLSGAGERDDMGVGDQPLHSHCSSPTRGNFGSSFRAQGQCQNLHQPPMSPAAL